VDIKIKIKVMQKILVTTDLSDNSKAGIRYALQMAQQTPCQIIFLSVVELLKPTRWTKEKFDAYLHDEIDTRLTELKKFTQALMKTRPVDAASVSFHVEISPSVHDTIIDIAQKNKADYICMSTRGAGNVKRYFGTNASALITNSPTKVIAVPSDYKVKPVTNIAYASDLSNISNELKAIKKIATLLDATINVYHYDFLIDVEEHKKKLDKIATKYQSDTVQFHFKKLHIEHSLAHHLNADIAIDKPSMIVLFTKQNRNWFDRLFLSSKTAQMTFDSKVPIVALRKNED